MAEYSTPEERTEHPTDRRMGELRKDGHLHQSNELVQCLTLLMGFFALQFIWDNLYQNLQTVFIGAFKAIADKETISVPYVYTGVLKVLLLFAPYIFLLTALIAATATLTVMLQTGWNIKSKKIHFQWPSLNPIAGIKKIFSIGGFVNTAKALVKLMVILPIGYFGLKAFAPHLIMLPFMSLDEISRFTSTAMSDIFWRIMYLLIAVAIFDFVYGRWKWLRDVKMTKDEVKDEKKAVEGDETTKRRMIAKGLQRAAQRIAHSVPKADVVITNPTHFAVALKYERFKMKAPMVVAKGQDHLALRIREIAKEAGVPVIERKSLARSLYANAKIGAEIPYDLYKAVAEVLAYVYRIKTPYRRPVEGVRQ
jgi:flagellar biosynthesis protein FlhB